MAKLNLRSPNHVAARTAGMKAIVFKAAWPMELRRVARRALGRLQRLSSKSDICRAALETPDTASLRL